MSKTTVFRDFTKYVSLNVLGMISISLYVLADTFFIARALGSYGLVALNLSIAVFSVMHGVGLMIGIGGATQFAILKGKGENANTVFTHSLFTALIAAMVFITIGMFFSEQIAATLGADEVILPLASVYMQTLLYFSVFSLLSNILIAFIRNDNNPKLAMAGMVTGSFANIIFDYIFLFPLAMGMFGAALATGLSLILSVIVLSFHFLIKRNTLRLQKRKTRVKQIANIVFLGSSTLVGELSFAITLITFNLVILGIAGNIGVAAYGIVANVAFVPMAMFPGVAQGIQPLVSRGFGSGDNIMVKKVLKYAIILVAVLSLIIYCAAYIYSENIVAVFNSEANPLLASLATTGIIIYFIGFIFAAVNIITAAFFSAIAAAKWGLLVSLLRGCVIIVPMVIFLSGLFQMNGVWFSFVATELIVCILSIALLHRKLKSPRF